MKPLDNGFRFKIDESCKGHIHAALRSKMNGGSWIKVEAKSPDEENTDLIWYKTETGLAGPQEKYLRCSMCRRRKNTSVINKIGPNTRLCMVCEKEILPQK